MRAELPVSLTKLSQKYPRVVQAIFWSENLKCLADKMGWENSRYKF